MKIYSNGKDRTLTGSFPARFKLLNNGVEVPFIRTGKGSVRISGEIPFGELDVEEVIKQKTPQPAKLDAQSIAIINKSDFDQIDLLNKKLAINQEQMNAHLSALTEHEATLANLETQNAQAIEQTNESMTEMAKVFGKEIQSDRERIKATAKSIEQDIAVSSEVLSAKIEAHETAKNPHKITKETIGLDKVENTSDLDKPVSKATQKELDKKADKSDIEDVRKAIKATEKKQERLVKSFDNANLYGGIGGNELPTGGKKGQILAKASNKTGDYEWADDKVVKKHNDLTGRDSADCHPISSITGLQSALDNKESTISDLQQIRENATAGKSASDTIATYGNIVTHNVSEFATSAQGTKADSAIQGVKVNGTELTPDADKKVNVSVPTQASDINAQPTLVSGTNIKTVNGNSLLGSGNLVISELPSQTSQSGKFLKTNGTSASWANIPTEIPSQSGQNGKFLTTNGSSVSWATVNALPSQTGNSGKYLTTNGTSASWGEIAEYTAQEVETLWGSL